MKQKLNDLDSQMRTLRNRGFFGTRLLNWYRSEQNLHSGGLALIQHYMLKDVLMVVSLTGIFLEVVIQQNFSDFIN